MSRTLIALAAATCLAGLPLSGAAASPHAPHPARVAADGADHWGYLFGDHLKSDWDPQLAPVTVSLPGAVTEIGTSNSTEYALLANGTVWAWGQGTNGQLGDGGTVNSFGTAAQVQFPAGVRIAYLPTDAMPYDTGLAVDTHGDAWGWGLNHGGSLCLGNDVPHATPVELPLSDVTALAGADGHAVYDAGGSVVSCGRNVDGVLGDGGTSASDVPVPVSGLAGKKVVALVSAWQNAGALLADGRYYDWGYNAQGQLGNGTAGQPSAVPVRVRVPGTSPVTQVAQGGSDAKGGQTLVMLADGSVFAWGSDTFSQLGDGGTGMQVSPELISPPAGVTYSVLASGGSTSYAIATTGEVYAWGAGHLGEIGDGQTTTAATPVAVDSGAAVISSTAGNVAVAGP